MENNLVRTANNSKTILLDSDYRSGAIIYSLTAILLLAYSVINSISWAQIRLKPTQVITYSGATILFAISIVIAIIAAISFIFSVYKLITTQQQRENITRHFYNWISKQKAPEDKSLTPLEERRLEETSTYPTSQLPVITTRDVPTTQDVIATDVLQRKKPARAGRNENLNTSTGF